MINSEFARKFIKYSMIFLLGMIAMLLVYKIPAMRYDINGDGKVTLYDVTLVNEYYIEHRNK